MEKKHNNFLNASIEKSLTQDASVTNAVCGLKHTTELQLKTNMELEH